jgi:hypothetical protein
MNVVPVKPFGWVRNDYIRWEEPGTAEAAFTPPYVRVYDEQTVRALQAKIAEYEAYIDSLPEPDGPWAIGRRY